MKKKKGNIKTINTLWFKLLNVFLGGVMILIGVVLVNTELKLLTWLTLIVGIVLFLTGIVRLD